MNEALKTCVELLERLRDTYLANHQTERAVIDAAVERGKEALDAKGSEEKDPSEPLEHVKVKRKYKARS